MDIYSEKGLAELDKKLDGIVLHNVATTTSVPEKVPEGARLTSPWPEGATGMVQLEPEQVMVPIAPPVAVKSLALIEVWSIASFAERVKLTGLVRAGSAWPEACSRVKEGAVRSMVTSVESTLLAGLVLPAASVAAAGWCFLAGTVIFSGCLFALALSGLKPLGAVVPAAGCIIELTFLEGRKHVSVPVEALLKYDS